MEQNFVKFRFWGGVSSTIALLLGTASIASAQTTTFPSANTLNFQTSGRERTPSVGDWYTSLTTASTQRFHRYVISVTSSDLQVAGGAVTISVLDAESNGALDEVDGLPIGSAGNSDPTRFQLLAPDGTLLSTLDVPAGAADGTTITFPPVAAPGFYEVRSFTGAFPISGDATIGLNNDDNGFRIQVNFPDAVLGVLQGTFQQNVAPTLSFPFYYLVGPGAETIVASNFDLDTGVLGGASVSYTSPDGATIAGTPSADAVWNVSNTLNPTGTTGDRIANQARFGTWRLNVADLDFNNQVIFSVSLLPPNNQPPILTPITPDIPRRAGNFTLTPSPNPAVSAGGAVCHPFIVTNRFFTSDIINLELTELDSRYTIQFRDAAGTTPLVDTDGDGRVDTGILQPNEAREVTLCVTPSPGAPSQYRPVVRGTSAMDRRVREQAIAAGVTPLPEQVQLLPKNYVFDAGAPALRLVKRITGVVRNGSVLNGVNFNQILDDPNSTEDNAAGWSQIPLVGILQLDNSTPVQSGDEVTYTVYYLSDGGRSALDVNLCDLVPPGTTYILNSAQVQVANASLTTGGTFFTPLAPLPANNPCPIPTNPNGAVIFNLGEVSNSAGANFGLIRFRVRVN